MTMLHNAAIAILRKFHSRQVTRNSASEAPRSNALQIPVNSNDCSQTDVEDLNLDVTIGSKGWWYLVDE
jgi:hypothetical protein